MEKDKNEDMVEVDLEIAVPISSTPERWSQEPFLPYWYIVGAITCFIGVQLIFVNPFILAQHRASPNDKYKFLINSVFFTTSNVIFSFCSWYMLTFAFLCVGVTIVGEFFVLSSSS